MAAFLSPNSNKTLAHNIDKISEKLLPTYSYKITIAGNIIAIKYIITFEAPEVNGSPISSSKKFIPIPIASNTNIKT